MGLSAFATSEEAKVNILLVDDHPANLVALSAVLSDPVYKLFEAGSGPEALKILHEENIALVLLDIQMPGMDGYEVARQIRNDPKTKDVPIIFITAVYREDASIRRGYEAGAQDYMGKPFDPEILRAKVAIYSNLFLKALHLEENTARLRESEERYRMIVEGAQEIIATTNVEGTITLLNLAFERLTGLKSKDWVGKSLVPLLHPDDIAAVLAHFGESARNNTPQLSQTRIKAADGHWIPVELSVQPLWRGQQLLGTVGVMRDISARQSHAGGRRSA
jgi:PAS domain S-box-containing protein